jgi:hypothetical protein
MNVRNRFRRLAAVVGVALAVGGCSMLTTRTTTEGWNVTCRGTATDECGAVASIALNNMARSRPDRPTGVITVVDRGACAPVPEWADGTTCFDAHVPLGPSEEVCLVVARRPALGGYGQVGGDELSGLLLPRDFVPDIVCVT